MTSAAGHPLAARSADGDLGRRSPVAARSADGLGRRRPLAVLHRRPQTPFSPSVHRLSTAREGPPTARTRSMATWTKARSRAVSWPVGQTKA
ncbi:hypothetical protein QFZ66_004529 [Streptomyces sp. B4I13]|nr:hypothetical protein [Streptomyces sp. B4I13]